MKSMWGALAQTVILAGSLAVAPAASAQDGSCCPEGEPAGPWQQIDDGADAEIREVEQSLNEILLVDETGRIMLREEFKEGLPFPPQRLEMMLATFVELGEDGKIRLRNPDAIRPYLPMIRGFLSQGGLQKLREMQNLPPEERREAMRRLFGDGAMPMPFGGGRGERARPEARPEARPGARPRADERRTRERRALAERGERRGRAQPGQEERDRPAGPRADVLERLERIERSVERIERMMERMARGRERGFAGPGAGERERERRPGGFMRRFFERFERNFDRFERGFDRDEPRRERRGPFGGGMGDMFERGRVWNDGLRRLREIMEPEDMRALGKALEALGRDMDPRDLRGGMNPMELFGKLQGVLTPEETARLMEVFSEFLATPEGRALAQEVEQSVKRLEGVVNSPEGARMMNRLRRLGERMGSGEQLPDRLEDLIRGRDRGRSEADRPHRERAPSSARRHREERREERRAEPRNPRAKLY